MLGEGAELVSPERLDLIKPGPQRDEGLGPEPVDTNPSIFLSPDDLDEPTGPQHPQVPAHGRPRHGHRLGKLPGPPRPDPEHVDDLPPRRLGKRGEHLVQILTHARNY